MSEVESDRKYASADLWLAVVRVLRRRGDRYLTQEANSRIISLCADIEACYESLEAAPARRKRG